MLDRKVRRIEREIADVRRLTAQLRDTVANPDTPTEDTEHGD